MSIIATGYPDPSDPTKPVPSACAWNKLVSIDFGLGSYFIAVWVNRSTAAADVVPLVDPVERFNVKQGDALSDGSTMRTIAEIDAAAHAAIQADPTLTPLQAVRGVIYADLMKHPKFAGCNPVQG